MQNMLHDREVKQYLLIQRDGNTRIPAAENHSVRRESTHHMLRRPGAILRDARERGHPQRHTPSRQPAVDSNAEAPGARRRKPQQPLD